MITSNQLRTQYLEFFRSKGHSVIPSASLIPDNDPTVLFTTAGMHPLVPYLMGERHPKGTRLTDVQKCVRTGDIDEVGDATHCTFFEMLGNWSLGDYFKEDSIQFSFEFLTKVLGIPTNKLAVTVFEGDDDAPRDNFSASVWEKLGITKENIFFLPKKCNWWGPAGLTGPCGPDTEIFIIRDTKACNKDCSPSCDCGKYVEIWNNVFMEYEKQTDGTFRALSRKNVDTGMGLERTIAMLNGYESVYETDVFAPIMDILYAKITKDKTLDSVKKAIRIIADHTRTATFMLGDEKGITPSNVDQGYILRRLIRRALRYVRQLELSPEIISDVAKMYIDNYKHFYTELGKNQEKVVKELELEVEKFNLTLEKGLKEYSKLRQFIQNGKISGKAAFKLYDTFGFPIEMTLELAEEDGLTVDFESYEECFRAHQQKSQMGAEQKFKGGLQDNSEQTTRLHTATHLLNSALKTVLEDDNIQQKGSNITAERLRFDFNFHRPMTDEEIKKVEDYVNLAISQEIDVVCEELSLDAAKKVGAIGVFENKYLDIVKMYTIKGYSREICGGPHASNTRELKSFKIIKEQSSSSGVRRIKATIGE